MWAAHSDGDKGCEGVVVVVMVGGGVKKRERGVGKKAEKKAKFTGSIHLLLA